MVIHMVQVVIVRFKYDASVMIIHWTWSHSLVLITETYLKLTTHTIYITTTYLLLRKCNITGVTQALVASLICTP